ncbi:MAG: flagellar hook-basal body complex protein [Jhaorihella sp.]
METTGYATLSRQSGLVREMRLVANNIANAATTGYRQEGLVFSEFIRTASGQPSLSMAGARIGNTSMQQGALSRTGGAFDLAIEGDGFFVVETAAGIRLTRAGSFSPNAEGELVTMNGHRVLDTGGAAVFVPPDAADLSVAADGTISTAGRAIGQIGLVLPSGHSALVREDGVMFRADGTEPAPQARIVQGFLEGSNVNAIDQVARMVEIQRAYELGQSFLETEDQRIRDAVRTLMR